MTTLSSMSRGRVVNSEELGDLWLEWQHLRHNNPEMFGLKSTGISKLNQMFGGGIELGQFVVVGGADKSGKSTLLLNIAKAFGEQGVNSLYLSAEMNVLQMGNMLFSRYSCVSRSKMRGLHLTDTDWSILEDSRAKIANLTIAWSDGLSTMENIFAVKDDIEQSTGNAIRAIFIDYFQLMESPSLSKRNRPEELAWLSRKAKSITLTSSTEPIAVIAAAQLNR
ncbi:MAG: DnaB-like helicase C-terminal domain-containing protein, partial [Pelodictyon phaeoclathratiforme]